VSLERSRVEVGQRVSVALAGWRAHGVNLSVCGNLARRGSADCNVSASQDASLANGSGPMTTYLFAFAPPTTCPCVVRASTVNQDEVVFAPIELVGVPIGPVVGPVLDAPVAVSIKAQSAVRGLVAALRSTLGGSTPYRVTVTLRNVSPETISTVSLAGSAERSAAAASVPLDLRSPGALVPGQTWQQQLRITVPAPMLGRARWRVIASGAGAPNEATVATSHMPIGLVVLTAGLAVDLVAMLWCFAARGLARRRPVVFRVQQDPLSPGVPAAGAVTRETPGHRPGNVERTLGEHRGEPLG